MSLIGIAQHHGAEANGTDLQARAAESDVVGELDQIGSSYLSSPERPLPIVPDMHGVFCENVGTHIIRAWLRYEVSNILMRLEMKQSPTAKLL